MSKINNELYKKKIVFLDTEFTGERQNTTLISISLITLHGKSIYLTLNDFDESQIDEWINKNVIKKINATNSINSYLAAQEIHNFLKNYSDNEKVYIVSAGLTLDIVLLIELYKHLPENKKIKNFAFKNLPYYLNHHTGIDLNTLLRVVGFDLSLPRESYVESKAKNRHNSLHDAKIVKLCFEKAIKSEKLSEFLKTL